MDENEKPGYGPKPDEQLAIDWLAPKTEQHSHVLNYLMKRIEFSERKMSQFHPRWRVNEQMLQAYVSTQDYEKILENLRDKKEGPGLPVEINVPFAWAQINTIVTYLLHMFAGRKPMFTLGSYRAEQVGRAKNLEMLLQYNADFKRFVRGLYFFLMDGETYGVCVMRTLWSTVNRTRTVIVPPAPEMVQIMASLGGQAQPTRQKQEYVAFEGNTCDNVDPFMFFPDPRVPMHEVAEKGEWVAWRAYEGRHMLLRQQAAGKLKWVDKVDPAERRDLTGNGSSSRGLRALGESHAGEDFERGATIASNFMVDQGTFEIVPAELGLSPSKVPEKWLFTILNGKQIVQAEQIETPHGKHPIVVAEPNSVGYAFGQLGTADFLGPSQQLMSWFMNSHVDNVRTALNNMLVVDPTKVEMKDLERPGPGKIIRLKNQAFGLTDPKSAVYQLQVGDVTRGHMSDANVFGRMASDLTGVSDNMRGLQDAGGRKTATEIRTTSEAGSSRLASRGKIYSAMGLTQLAEMWTMNYQNFMTQEFEMAVLGQAGAMDTVRITPDNIQGDFTYPVQDGTLPMDKVGMLDVWKEILLGVAQDPELRQQFSLVKIFEWVAELGGAQNIQQFKLNVVPNGQAQTAMTTGQGIPMSAVMGGLG